MLVSRRHFFRNSAIAFGAAAITSAAPEALFALEPPVKFAGGALLLNSNDNPYGPFPAVMKELLRSLNLAHRYPDYDFGGLLEALAKLHNCKSDEIALGCGSGDVMRMAAEALCTRNNHVVTSTPTYGAMEMYARRRNIRVSTVPLRDHANDMDGLFRAATGADVVYICNPHNPTGTITPRAEIEQFIAKMPGETYLLVDEAYHHFVESPHYVSFAEKRSENPRVIVLRTFSKMFGMAGLRVGYAVGEKRAIEKLSNQYVFDNPNILGVRAAAVALEQTSALKTMQRRIRMDREHFIAEAKHRGLATLPSQTNFVMVDSGKPVQSVIDHFKRNNILIGKPFPPYDTYARISLGLPAEMQRFWAVWDRMTVSS